MKKNQTTSYHGVMTATPGEDDLVVAARPGRRALGCDLNKEFARFGDQRIRDAGG